MRILNFSGKAAAIISILLSIPLCMTSLSRAAEPAMDTGAIERLTGAKGALDEKEGVFKVSVPRKDLSVTVTGVKMSPPMGLTSWAAFKRDGGNDMVMGDMVMTEDQVSPVMSAALDSGLEVTALHNHFIWDSPKIMFMHIAGMGPEQDLATAVGKVFTTIKETSARTERPSAQIDPAHSSLDPAKLDSALGVRGQYKDGVYKFVVGRTTRMHDITIGNQMGVNTWGAFAGSEDKAIVDDDFAMREAELQNVLKSPRGGGYQYSGDPSAHGWGGAPNHVRPLLGCCTRTRSRERTCAALDVTHD
jgi:uncharacterized protein DUF1259